MSKPPADMLVSKTPPEVQRSSRDPRRCVVRMELNRSGRTESIKRVDRKNAKCRVYVQREDEKAGNKPGMIEVELSQV